ncbi:MAG: multidrug ABC transporter ATP-binding protein, partial [Pseudomonadota bacterium]|nr:multidrug ABC transporter ATP-binding protein [Pseudomonadota bacterium]
MGLLKRFEKLLHAYPDAEPVLPPKGFVAFVWAASEGARGYILLLAGLSASMAIFNALLFAMLGRIVDWLSVTPAANFWNERGPTLALLV